MTTLWDYLQYMDELFQSAVIDSVLKFYLYMVFDTTFAFDIGNISVI